MDESDIFQVPVKITGSEEQSQHCMVFLSLKRSYCERLAPGKSLNTQLFYFKGEQFYLSAHCNMDQSDKFLCFGLFLGMHENSDTRVDVTYDFAAMVKPTEEYVSAYSGNYSFAGGKSIGYRNLFGIQWDEFIADESVYFIDDLLHLRAKLTKN